MVAAKDATSVGLIMGTLGRQGNAKLVQHLREMIEDGGRRRVTLFLMSEIFPQKLAKIADVDCFVQVACPRLSIDWGYAFDRPLLSPFECAMVFGKEKPAAMTSSGAAPAGVAAAADLEDAAVAAAAAASSSSASDINKSKRSAGGGVGVWDGKYYPMEHYAKSPSGSWGVYATRNG
jgi:hypothetical protein